MKAIAMTAALLASTAQCLAAQQPTMQYGPYPGEVMQGCNSTSTPAPASAPAALIIHGGWDTSGSRNLPNPQLVCRAFAQAGFHAVSMDYRLNAPWPSAWQDVQAATRALRKAGSKQVLVIGLSAGAYDALGAGFAQANIAWKPTDPLGEARQNGGYSSRPDALIGVTGFYNLTTLPSTLPAIATLAPTPLMRQLASVTSLVRSDIPPTLLIEGTQDAIVPKGQSEELFALLAQAQAPVWLLRYPGGHVFAGLSPAARDGVIARMMVWGKQALSLRGGK